MPPAIREKFIRSGWMVTDTTDRPRVTTVYRYSKGPVVIAVEQQGDCETEWTITITCKDCIARSVKYGGTPSQSLRQAIASMISCIGNDPWSSKIRKELIKLQRMLPPRLEE